MILYHFPTSPFARRVRLILALKGLSAELRDARANPAFAEDVRRLNPAHTVPVLVDGERVLADSAVIAQYLDRKHPAPPLWPGGLEGVEAFEYTALADCVITTLADLGLRYHALHQDERFPRVRDPMLGRAQRSLERLAERVRARTAATGPLCGGRWGAADIALFTLVAWLEGLPVRAATYAPAKQMVDLGWHLPDVLRAWADPHRTREDVLALG